MTEPPGGHRPDVGVCARCRHASVQRSARGSEFWRCRAADHDPRLRRYPPLPVPTCPAFQPGTPTVSGEGARKLRGRA